MSDIPGAPVLGLCIGHDRDGEVVVFAARETGIDVSATRGQTWTAVWQAGLASSVVVSSSYANDGLIIAGVQGGIIRSDDHGVTWQFCPLGEPDTLVGSLSMGGGRSSTDLILAGTLDDGVYRSTDQGNTWQPANTGIYIPRITSVHTSPHHRCLVGTESGVFVSNNGGETWDDHIASDIDDEVSSVCGDDDYLIAGTASGNIVVCDLRSGDCHHLAESSADEAILSLSLVRASNTRTEVVAITRTQARRYRIEGGGTDTPLTLIDGIALPIHASSATVFASDARISAILGSFDGKIRAMSMNPTIGWTNA